MEMESLKIGKKTVRLPIIQGGMGIGISLGGLAGAVAKEGGVGIISAAQILISIQRRQICVPFKRK